MKTKEILRMRKHAIKTFLERFPLAKKAELGAHFYQPDARESANEWMCTSPRITRAIWLNVKGNVSEILYLQGISLLNSSSNVSVRMATGGIAI